MNYFDEKPGNGPDTVSSGDVIEATAMVVAIDGDMAVLETVRTNACASCGAAGACGTSALGEILGRKQNLLRINNTFDAVPGEQVIIGLAEGDLMLASLAAYMLPLITMIGAALVVLGMGGNEVMAALAALAGFGTGLLGANRFASRSGNRFTPHFLRRAPLGFTVDSCHR